MPSGLVLTGGGARAAYQAGVLKCMTEILNLHGAAPFDCVACSSAGAINGAFLAARADQFASATEQLADLWCTANSGWIFDVRGRTVSKIFMGFLKDAMAAFTFGRHNPDTVRYLMDTAPLRRFLEEHIDFDVVAQHIQKGTLGALSVAATHYASASTVHFTHTSLPLMPWERFRRRAVFDEITLDHVLASSAIPMFFPPQLIHGEYYGDGSVRNTNPLSPAIHLGADKLMIIGVRNFAHEVVETEQARPSFSRLGGVMLNAMFVDAVDADIERLRLNNKLCQDVCDIEDRKIKPIQTLYLHPSEDLSRIAHDHVQQLPKSLRRFLLSFGTLEEASALISYLLFDESYCQTLVTLGYEDAQRASKDIDEFFSQ